jgi:hypothetical protein
MVKAEVLSNTVVLFGTSKAEKIHVLTQAESTMYKHFSNTCD